MEKLVNSKIGTHFQMCLGLPEIEHKEINNYCSQVKTHTAVQLESPNCQTNLSIKFSFFKKKIILFIVCVCLHANAIRKQIVGSSSLLPPQRLQELNSDCQASSMHL